MKRAAAYLFLLIFLFNYSFCQQPGAKGGILDLRDWNFTRSGIADLNGQWEFYWKSLYTPSSFDTLSIKPSKFSNVPDFWNKLIPGKGIFEPGFGYATYRLKVLLPASHDSLALKFLTISSAYKLFINGKEILNVGEIGTSKQTAVASYTPAIVLVTPEKDQLDIIIQVSNFDYATGGIWDIVKVGTQEQIHKFWLKNILWDFFMAGSFSLIGAFYFVIYFFLGEE
jgi:hypothetical protein